MITDALLPARLSAPYVFKISDNSPKEPPPETGRKSAIGKTSDGMPILSITGEANDESSSIAPDALSIDEAVITPSRGGKIVFKSSSPSYAPSKNTSYVF